MSNVNSTTKSQFDDNKTSKDFPKKVAVVSCEVCESVKSPQHENALEDMPEKGVQEHARTESSVIKDRYQANVRQPVKILAP